MGCIPNGKQQRFGFAFVLQYCQDLNQFSSAFQSYVSMKYLHETAHEAMLNLLIHEMAVPFQEDRLFQKCDQLTHFLIHYFKTYISYTFPEDAS